MSNLLPIFILRLRLPFLNEDSKRILLNYAEYQAPFKINGSVILSLKSYIKNR
jgi:hypothetical protein